MTTGSKLIDETQLQPGDKVIDVGCGDGRLTLMLFDKCPKVHSILGVDISKSQVEAATQLAAEKEVCSTTVAFHEADFLKKEFDSKFTLAFSAAAIHWIGEEAYRKIHSLLASGGRISVEQAGDGGYVHLHETARKITKQPRFNRYFDGFSIDSFYYTPTYSQMQDLLTEIGFKNISIQKSEVVHDESSYPAFTVASLHPYYDRLPSELRDSFRDAFLDECRSSRPSASSVRLFIKAIKQ